MKVKNGKVERNIYVETRGPSLRFVVEVSPLPKDRLTVDLDQYEAGLQWARRRRVELLEQKSNAKKSVVPASAPALAVVARMNPADVRISDAIQHFQENKVPKLASAASDSSRLKGLQEWFGHLTLGELTTELLHKWLSDRESGVLGAGRISYPPGFSKNDIYRSRQALKAGRTKWRDGTAIVVPAPILVPPSAQTIRHEMTLLRRTLIEYFQYQKLKKDYGSWLECHDVMTLVIPDKPDPRETRVDEKGLQAMVKELNDPMLAAFAQFAVMTTLRRSEVCSLRWEDLDLEKGIIFLRKSGHFKSKTHTREVPLLPPAIRILTTLGIQKKGPLFSITPSGISQAIRRAADRAGLYDVRLHDLRREGISRLLELLEASFEDVCLFSGHRDLQVLKDHYARPSASEVGKRLAVRPGLAAMISET